MKLIPLLGDIWKSVWIPPATQQYPFVKRPSPAHLRGMLVYDTSACTGCQLCVKDCPAQALELITLDKKAKRFVMRYHVDRCTFCAQCVESCRFNCIGLKNDQWELASTDRGDFTIMYGRSEDIAKLSLIELAGKKEYAAVAEPAAG